MASVVPVGIATEHLRWNYVHGRIALSVAKGHTFLHSSTLTRNMAGRSGIRPFQKIIVDRSGSTKSAATRPRYPASTSHFVITQR